VKNHPVESLVRLKVNHSGHFSLDKSHQVEILARLNHQEESSAKIDQCNVTFLDNLSWLKVNQ